MTPDEDRLQRLAVELEKAQEWVCECGERCNPCSGTWRFNGRDWEHSHGSLGHFTAERKPERELSDATLDEDARLAFGIVKNVDWSRLQGHVNRRVALLGAISGSLEDTHEGRLIARDLILPAIDLLRQFDQRIEEEA